MYDNPDAPPSLLPHPADVQRRLGELIREERIMRRLLTLSLSAYDERARRNPDRPTTEVSRRGQ